MSLLTLVSSQRLTVSQTAFINSLQASTINVSSLFSPTIPSVSSLVSTTTGLQGSIVSTSFGIQISIISTSSGLTGSLLSTSFGLDTLDSRRIVSTSAGLTGTIGSSASSFSTTLGNFQAGFPSTVSSVYGSSFTTLALNVSTQNIVNVIQPSTTFLYVAVGSDSTAANKIKYSLDGIVWSNSSGATFTGTAKGVAWNGSLWVAVGADSTANNTIKYSSNGISWTNISANGFTDSGNKVIWNGQIWVAVGSNTSQEGTIKYSFDGITWSNTTNGFFSFSAGEGIDVAWNGKYFVAVGQATTLTPIRYSINGIAWLDINPLGFTFTGRGVTWNGSMWIAVGQGATILQTILNSVDGINWSPASNNGFRVGSSPFSGWGVSWNGDYFLAGGQDQDAIGTAKISYDGLNWSNAVTGIPINSYLTYSAWNGRYWVGTFAESANTSIKYSFDGRTWIAGTTGFTSGGYGVAFSSNASNAYIQPNLSILYSNIPYIIRSTNQIIATPTTININNVLSVNASNNRVGVNITLPRYLLDVNGSLNATSLFVNTSSIATVITALSGGAAFPSTVANVYASSFSTGYLFLSSMNQVNVNPIPNRFYVITGTDATANNTIKYSLDGITWVNSSGTGFPNGGLCAAWNGRIWLAGGADNTNSNNCLRYSFNGITWTNANLPNLFLGMQNINAIGWNGFRWVIAGGTSGFNGRFLFSDDGINYTIGTTIGQVATAITWAGSQWVGLASGNQFIFTSSNGSNFISNTNVRGFPNGGQGLAWNGRVVVGVGINGGGNRSTIQYSIDSGLTWQFTLSGAFTSNAFCVAWNGQYWLAGGEHVDNSDSGIKYSFDGINWSNTNIGASVVAPCYTRSITWDGTKWIAGFEYQTSNTSIKYSVDGINWLNSPGAYFSSGGVPYGVAFASNFNATYRAPGIMNFDYNVPININRPDSNIIFYGSTFMTLNNTLTVNQSTFRVGINNTNPQTAVDVNGTLTASQISFISIPPSSSNLWVAVGQDATANNSIKYSLDGSNWSNSAGTGFATQGYGVAYNGSLWVAVGQDGASATTLKYSLNGINWSNSAGIGFATAGRAVAWNGRLWVAVGQDATQNATIKYSLNGINWLDSAGTGFTSVGLGVGWNGRQWVAVGQDSTSTNTIKYSVDGITWSNSAGSGFTVFGTSVAWNGRLWVATGSDATENNRIKYSFDGINWSNSTGATFDGAGNVARGVSWNGRLWVAAGEFFASSAASLKYSVDGINWLNSASGGFTSSGRNVAWNGQFWVAVGSDGTSNNRIKYSLNGINWSNSLGGAFSLSGWGIAFSSNTTLPYRQSNLSILPQNIPIFITSTNVIFAQPSSMIINDTLIIDGQWDRVGVNCNAPRNSLDVAGSMNVSSIEFVNIAPPRNNFWVAVGSDGSSSNAPIKYSLDGLNWSNSAGIAFTSSGWSVAWNGRMWVAVGSDSTQNNTIKYSLNGINWLNSAGTGFSISGRGVAWNGTLWVAVGIDAATSNNFKYSYDGINWASAVSGVNNSQGLGVAWNGSIWLAMGFDSTQANRIKNSVDGLNWSNSAGNSFTNPRRAAWNGRIWVVVGEASSAANCIEYSADGINWSNSSGTGFSSAGYDVAWNGRLWVAVGSDSTANNTIQYSINGVNWTAVAANGFTGGGRTVAWNGALWIAGGTDSTQNNTLKYSTDGINWSNSSGTGFATEALGIAFQSNVIPSYAQSNFLIAPSNAPYFLTSTNTIFAQPSSLVINNSFVIDEQWNRVGINCNYPAYTLDVAGEINSSGGTRSNGTFLTSDRRIKENIISADLDLCYSNVKQLPLRRFDFIPEFKATKYDGKQIGFIADEVSTVFPKSVKEYPTSVAGWSTIHFLNYEQIFLSHYGATQKLINLVEQQASTLEGQAFTIQTLVSTVQQLQNNG